MSFTGFPQEALTFFDELTAHNNRDWFLANKPRYETFCKAPMLAFLAEVEADYGPGKIFRINRDVRFSADKSPYKTNIAATLGRHYVSLSAEGLYAGSGSYMLEPEALARYRAAVDDEASGTDLAKLTAALSKKGYTFSAHDSMKTVPRGFAKDHPRAELLRHKGLAMFKSFDPTEPWVSTRKALARLITVYEDARRFNEWFSAHVG